MHDLDLQFINRRCTGDYDGTALSARQYQVLGRARPPTKARMHDRALLRAGTYSTRQSWMEDISTEASNGCLRGGAEHRRGLGIEVADAPLTIDADNALDDACDDRFGLGLLPPQVVRQLEELPAHLFESGS